uniref:Ly6/PLAUR domain-containing protein 1 isoform X1 n=1 Tax=Petromyzon marinus TaxID=7757 RepID=A0AAJ7SKW6_PETMA|nr:ly6/PLAUR domain-containing protein 1 isoform X1 [Petromyzon marinus]
MRVPLGALALLCLLSTGRSLQIQCYQCEEFHLSECSAPKNIANCTVNVQDVCQKEVMIRSNGTFYRKSCASSAACLIAAAGYQRFCRPGRMGSVCISCCNTAFCNGPRPARRRNSARRSAPPPGAVAVLLLQLLLQLLPVLLPLLQSPPMQLLPLGLPAHPPAVRGGDSACL